MLAVSNTSPTSNLSHIGRLAKWSACGGAGPWLSRAAKQALVVPEGVSQRFRSASVEVLQGLRVLLDHRIEKLTHAEEPRAPRVAVD